MNLKHVFLLCIIQVYGVSASGQEKAKNSGRRTRIVENIYLGVSLPRPTMSELGGFAFEQLEEYQNGMLDLALTLKASDKWRIILGLGLLTGNLVPSDYAAMTYNSSDSEEFWDTYNGVGSHDFFIVTGVYESNILPNIGISRPFTIGKICLTPSINLLFSDLNYHSMFYASENIQTGEIRDGIVNINENIPLAVGTEYLYPTFGLNLELRNYIIGIQFTDVLWGINIPNVGLRLGYNMHHDE